MTNWRSLSKLTLTLFLGPGFTSTSSVSVIKQLHNHKSMPRRILNNTKIEIYDFVLMFETQHYRNRNAMRKIKNKSEM